MKKIVTSDREKKFIVLCAMILLLFILYRFAYAPLKQADESFQDKIASLEEQYSQTKSIILKNKPFQKEYPEALTCFKQSIPDKQQITAITAELESLAQEKRISLKASMPVKSKSGPQSSDFTINVSLEGKFENILEFVYTLQNCPHLYSVSELKINSTAESGPKLLCRLVLIKSLIK